MKRLSMTRFCTENYLLQKKYCMFLQIKKYSVHIRIREEVSSSSIFSNNRILLKYYAIAEVYWIYHKPLKIFAENYFTYISYIYFYFCFYFYKFYFIFCISIDIVYIIQTTNLLTITANCSISKYIFTVNK